MLINKTSSFHKKTDVQYHGQPHYNNGVAMITPRNFDIILGRVSLLVRRQLPFEHIECRHIR